MILPRFDYAAPTTLAQVCELLAEAGSKARLLAGGTDLLLKMKRGELRPQLLISLGGLASKLDQVEVSDGGLRVGPLCTMSHLERHVMLGPESPWAGLAEGAGAVGGPIIRNRATVGGNIVNARPCADSVPPLITLGAELHVESRDRGLRVVPIDGFISGPGQTGLRSDEVVTAIAVPAPHGPAGSSYLKITRRSAMEVTLVGCAASVLLDAKATVVEQARIVLTSVAPVPLRVPAAERVMNGCGLDRLDPGLREAGEAARAAAHPIDDHRAPAFYRSEMVAVTVRRAVGQAVRRALDSARGGGPPPECGPSARETHGAQETRR